MSALRTGSGYDAHGNPGGMYTLSNPPPGKRFGAFAGRSVQWSAALPLGASPLSQRTSPPSQRTASATSTQSTDAVTLLFQALDSDGDGVITKEELSEALSHPRPSSRNTSPTARAAATPERAVRSAARPMEMRSARQAAVPTSSGEDVVSASYQQSPRTQSGAPARALSPAAPTLSKDIQDLDLYIAAALGHVADVSRLVGEGRDPLAGLDGDTPLHAAAGNGNEPVVAVLLEAGVHPDQRIAGHRTAMHTACEAGRKNAVATLLKAGADPQPVDSAGDTPRDLAEREGHVVCVALIDQHLRDHPVHTMAPLRRAVAETTPPEASTAEKKPEIAEMEAAVQSSAPEEAASTTAPSAQQASMSYQAQPPPPSAAATPTPFDTGSPSRTVSMADQLASKLDTVRRNKEMGMVDTPEQSEEETDGDPWAREANRLAMKAKATASEEDTEAYRNRHKAVLDSTELTIPKLVSKVLRLEKLGKLALSSLHAVRAEQSDKDDTDLHMEVSDQRDEQIKGILHTLEKFEAVCSVIDTATCFDDCIPLVKQRREDCANLLGPVREVLSLTKKRGRALASRIERLDSKIANATEGITVAETNKDTTLYAFEPTTIEDAIADFTTFFDFESDSGSTLCHPCVQMLEKIRVLTAADASTYAEVGNGGTPDIAALQDRTADRQQTIGSVLKTLASAERHIHTFLRVSLKHFQAEHERVLTTAERVAALDVLLSEKIVVLEKLPEADKDAHKYLKTLRRTDKGQMRVKCIIRAVENRLEEHDEFGALSPSDSDHESDSDDDEDELGSDFLSSQFADLTQQQLKDKVEEKREELGELLATRKETLVALHGLLYILPELRFHPQLHGLK